jgi:hypothetical protein
MLVIRNFILDSLVSEYLIDPLGCFLSLLNIDGTFAVAFLVNTESPYTPDKKTFTLMGSEVENLVAFSGRYLGNIPATGLHVFMNEEQPERSK